MFRAFNLVECDWSEIPLSNGEAVRASSSAAARKALDSFLNSGTLDGTKMSEHWFPELEADVFISHSHKDEKTAIKFAGWLKSNLGLNAFIDSCVWGHSDALLKQIDDKLCPNIGEDSYSYEKRNGSTSHVHMMLAAAIAQMIDKTECVFFVKTPDSITTKGVVDKTYSPWIYYELGMLRLIRRRSKEAHRPMLKEGHVAFSKGEIDETLIEYEVDLSSLTQVSHGTLNRWTEKWNNNRLRRNHALDELYSLAPETT